MRRGAPTWLALTVAAGVLAGCGGSTIEPDPAVQAFVGTWDGVVFTITSDADPSIVLDVLAVGPFFIVVEPSGQYTATLSTAFGPAVEIGQLTVIGSTIRLDPSFPATAESATSIYSFTTPDYLILDGPTEHDFNLDDIREPGQAHIELQRR